MAMENGPVEDVFPIENGDFPASHISLLEGILSFTDPAIRVAPHHHRHHHPAPLRLGVLSRVGLGILVRMGSQDLYRKWLVIPVFFNPKKGPFIKENDPILTGRKLTKVINHLLTGIIL